MRGIFTLLAFIVISVNAIAQSAQGSQGPRTAGTGFGNISNDDNRNNASADWNNATNARTDNSSYATVTLSGNNTSNSAKSEYLQFENFDFDIRNTYSLTGIEVIIETDFSGANGFIQLVDDDGDRVGTPKQITSSGTITLGGPNDRWGTTLTRSGIEDDRFGIVIYFDKTASGTGSTVISVDYAMIKIYYLNPAPTATPNSYPATGNLSITSGNLINNGTRDFDPDNEGITAQVATQPSSGEVVINPNGGFTYTPPTTNFPGGVITFTYTVTDGGTPASISAPATVTTTYPQPRPTATGDRFTAPNTHATITGNVITNTIPNGADSDPQGQILTAAFTTPDIPGTFSPNPDGSFSYTPPSTFTGGEVTFTYTLTDNGNPSATSTISTVTLSFPEGAALPVDFTGFTAQKAPAGVQLIWTVGTEINVDRYEAERSTNGSSFTKIGSVPATGSSSYNFIDAQPQSGTVYYRVRNVDHDGQFAYTTVLKYKNGQTEILSKVFPTATRGKVTLQHAPVTGKAQIIISSLEGRILRSLVPAKGSTTTPIDLSGYATGTYPVRHIKEGGESETFRVIKQ